MVLVEVRGQETAVTGYGETAPGSGVRPDANTVVRLCSLSKIFAGDLLMRLNAEGKVRLDDPLQRFAPAGKQVPRGPRGEPITLLELAMHTSGLPREVLPYPAKTPHFTFPDEKTRWEWLERQTLSTTPGTAALYSNAGFDLLGDALARAARKSYAELLNQRIVKPLGLRETTLTPTKEQCARLLKGDRDEGPCTDTLASGASSGLYSTATDMVQVLKYLLSLNGMPAQPKGAMVVYRRPGELKRVEGLSHAGDPSGIGAGWVQRGEPGSASMVMEKTGGGAGFMTYVALNPGRQTGVFLAAMEGKGHAQIDLYQEANNLLADLAGVPPLPPKVHGTHPRRRQKQRAARSTSVAAK